MKQQQQWFNDSKSVVRMWPSGSMKGMLTLDHKYIILKSTSVYFLVMTYLDVEATNRRTSIWSFCRKLSDGRIVLQKKVGKTEKHDT